MKSNLIYIFLSIISIIAADADLGPDSDPDPEPESSDIFPITEDTVHISQEEPGDVLVLLDECIPTVQEIHSEAQVTRVCSYGIVFFQVPRFRSLRSPFSILADLTEIYCAVKRNETDFSSYNFHIQQLLFERLMISDSHSDVSALQSLDRSFRETYEILYNKIFNSPIISMERRARVQEVSSHLLESRSPLIRVLFMDRTTPNDHELNSLRSAVASAFELQVEECPQAPEERLLSDISRGISVISARIMSLMFQGMTRSLMFTQTLVPVTPCASTLVYESSSRPWPIKF